MDYDDSCAACDDDAAAESEMMAEEMLRRDRTAAGCNDYSSYSLFWR